jgi:hypothetical protein
LCRREKVEFGLHFRDASWNIHVNGESVLQIAPPVERLSIGLEEESGKIDDRAVGSVLARNPFWVVESEVAGSGWDLQRGVKNLPGSMRCIDRNGDRGCVGAPAYS